MPCNNVAGGTNATVCDANPEVTGMVFPIDSAFEAALPKGVRVAIYLGGFIYCLFGVSIIADIFMGAIEKITSKKKLYKQADGTEITAESWNSTVANLSLMALGSSAPEILLNVIGIFPTFQSGELGPGAIVGSAAFNLLGIIAVCLVAIPNNDVRRIWKLKVFSVTATFSIVAYLWLLVILVVFTPSVVTLVEGVMTFAFFWVLLVIAYVADIKEQETEESALTEGLMKEGTTPDDVAVLEYNIRNKYGKARILTIDETMLLMRHEYPQKISRAMHRANAIRLATGGGRIIQEQQYQNDAAAMLAAELLTAGANLEMAQVATAGKAKITFERGAYAVLESVGNFGVVVRASGVVKGEIRVKWETVSGTAKAGEDFEAASGEVVFTESKLEDAIQVNIMAIGGLEKTEHFTLRLIDPEQTNVSLGISEAKVSIVDPGDVEGGTASAQTGELASGVLRFENPKVSFIGKEVHADLEVKVVRVNGSFGKVGCSYATEDGSALAPEDYEAVTGNLFFEHGETEKTITIAIKHNKAWEADENFRLIINEATGGATFDDKTDGGADSCILTVTIIGQGTGGLLRFLGTDWDSMTIGNQSYKANFISACYAGGGPDAEGVTCFDRFLHYLSLPWKIIFAFVPPAEYCGGWLCFGISLLMIGVVTVVIGDLAQLLGCVMGISDSFTAITIVAVGSSLPDTYASRTAAILDPYADNSIGNVTGSNSVNVFLGLGLPWMICCFYWALQQCEPGDAWSLLYPEQAAQYPDGIFVVQAGDLVISVSLFCGCAVTAMGILIFRRQCAGGELGGPACCAWLSSLIFWGLWIFYIGGSWFLAPSNQR